MSDARLLNKYGGYATPDPDCVLTALNIWADWVIEQKEKAKLEAQKSTNQSTVEIETEQTAVPA